jgi:hypothetical protein
MQRKKTSFPHARFCLSSVTMHHFRGNDDAGHRYAAAYRCLACGLACLKRTPAPPVKPQAQQTRSSAMIAGGVVADIRHAAARCQVAVVVVGVLRIAQTKPTY